MILQICTKIDGVCQRLLNRGFIKMTRRHSFNLKTIKNLLPRRESERRNHHLAKHADILTCIETRISMLSMTYSKYIDLDLCCFIPGKVIDEVNNILKLLDRTTRQPLRTHEVLQELRDISSMAIEHFDEKIANILKKSFLDIHSNRHNFTAGLTKSLSESSVLSSTVEFTSPSPVQTERKSNCHSQCQESKNNRMRIMRMERKYKTAMKRVSQMTRRMKLMKHFRNQMSEMASQIVDLKRRIEESDAKNREISANISQITSDSGTATANKPRNIKPRTATIILKRRITEPRSCTEAKRNKADE